MKIKQVRFRKKFTNFFNLSGNIWLCKLKQLAKERKIIMEKDAKGKVDTSESLDPSKLLSFILADPIKDIQSSIIMTLLCTYTCRNKGCYLESHISGTRYRSLCIIILVGCRGCRKEMFIHQL